MTSAKKIESSYTTRSLIKLILLFISFSVSFNIYRFIKLIPAGNNYDVKVSNSFFPESNYLLLLGIIALTFITYYLLSILQVKKTTVFRAAIVLVLSYSLFIGVIAPGYAKYQNNIDTFHNGEQLAPALALEQGKRPYTDILTLRGAGEDILTPWLSFKLFGESIGSYFMITVLLQLLSAIVFYIFLSKIFTDDLQFLVLAVWFTISSYNGIYNVRDIFVWLSLMIVFASVTKPRINNLLYWILGFIAMISTFYSFDRGIFINILVLMLIGITLLFKRTGHSFTFQPRSLLTRAKIIIPIGIGYVSAFLIAAILLGGSGIKYFIINTLQLSKYQGIIFNFSYPAINSQTVYEWLPILVMVVCIFTTAKLAKQKGWKLEPNLMYAIILTIFGIVTFRAATGRPDSGHIAYGAPIIFIALFYMFFNNLKEWGEQYKNLNWNKILDFAPLYLLVLLAMSPKIINYIGIAEMSQTSLSSVRTILTGPSKPDSYWYTKEVTDITSYINSNTNKSASMFVFSSDPIYYYSTKLKNPSRYYISWFADPAPLESEVLESLKKNNPQVILYESGSYYDRPEFISMKDRLPNINDWILQNYTTETKIGNATILSK